MEQNWIELYDKEEIAALRTKRFVWTAVAALVLLTGLAICVALCIQTRPSNMGQMLKNAILVSTVTGWIVITILHFAIAELLHIEKHAESMLTGESETKEGPFTLTKEYVRIKKGVSMVRLRGAAPGQGVQVFEQKAKLLKGKRIARVRVVYGFAVAYQPEEGGSVCD